MVIGASHMPVVAGPWLPISSSCGAPATLPVRAKSSTTSAAAKVRQAAAASMLCSGPNFGALRWFNAACYVAHTLRSCARGQAMYSRFSGSVLRHTIDGQASMITVSNGDVKLCSCGPQRKAQLDTSRSNCFSMRWVQCNVKLIRRRASAGTSHRHLEPSTSDQNPTLWQGLIGACSI